MGNFDDIKPGSLVSLESSSGNGEWIFGIIHYIVAAIVFLAYAKARFSLGIAILYSLFWEFGLIISLICN